MYIQKNRKRDSVGMNHLYELTSKLEQVGYGYVYTDDTIVTLSPSNDHCVNLIIDVVDLEDSVKFRDKNLGSTCRGT